MLGQTPPDTGALQRPAARAKAAFMRCTFPPQRVELWLPDRNFLINPQLQNKAELWMEIHFTRSEEQGGSLQELAGLGRKGP